MVYPVSDDFKQEEVKLEGTRLLECYVLDLASVYEYMSFYSSGNKIVSRNRVGIFPINRIKVGDVLSIKGTSHNDGEVTVSSITQKQITVSESLTDEGISSPILAYLNNFQYYIKNEHDVYFYKFEGDEIVNTEQLYTAANIRREEIKTTTDKTMPALKIMFQNVDRVMESLVQNRKYLRGCFIYIINAYEVSFPTGSGYQYIGISPNYLSQFSEKWKIDGADSDMHVVSLECRPKFYMKDVQIPRGKLGINFCRWAEEYGGPNCDPDGTNIDYSLYPTCNGTIDDCRKRGNIKRIGLFPGIPRNAIYIR